MLDHVSDTTTRERMISTAMTLFRREGYQATSWRRLVEQAGTPWGSAYHHFPGGKEQLAVAAIELGTAVVAKTVRRAFERNETVEDAVAWWYRKAGEALAADDYRGGCPLATITLEMAHASPVITKACQDAFAAWHELLVELLGEVEDPEDVATAIMTNLEGALLVSRVRRSPEPLERAARHVALVVRAA
ncbi:TetR family transcriptional regulator [Amycolatopsis keratiniphila subsp. nogabecina]|uniref:TetR family transcriptional regulator n=1 Tax=Amycolatopsis keratiniphila subsp. keratiniphila TaxID=227715 RepID=A0A1W2M2K6_9PSEU|nr:TetR family transcriptional regulator [Amycolatopsis keratiniphila subsp. nogabecina]ONF74271.1 TetR family transcriptional regulator [Amycolatopsis keratiniphila subsp. keratiniphila]SDT99332.1 transcriptional regulator, TetR family [Amycolatopsis keratiniphila]